MKKINSPLDEATIIGLKAGDQVALSGVVYTARDKAHTRLTAMIERNETLPVDLKGQAIYYAGPAPAREGEVIGSIGPTTAARMDKYTKTMFDCGIKAMIGKGGRSPEVREAIGRMKVIYFIAVGGAAAYLSQFVVKSEVIAFEELGPEAIYRLEIKELPLFVGLDAKGGSAIWPDFS